ncbi:Protein GVQW1 [Plecturocebus cupreus]
MGFQYVTQASLNLLSSSDIPTLASQRSGITGVRHCAWPQKDLLIPFPKRHGSFYPLMALDIVCTYLDTSHLLSSKRTGLQLNGWALSNSRTLQLSVVDILYSKPLLDLPDLGVLVLSQRRLPAILVLCGQTKPSLTIMSRFI